jgi:hypothetical protein
MKFGFSVPQHIRRGGGAGAGQGRAGCACEEGLNALSHWAIRMHQCWKATDDRRSHSTICEGSSPHKSHSAHSPSISFAAYHSYHLLAVPGGPELVCGLCDDARNSSVFIYLHDITGCDPSNGDTDLCDYETGFCDSNDSFGEGTAVEADSLGRSSDQVHIPH